MFYSGNRVLGLVLVLASVVVLMGGQNSFDTSSGHRLRRFRATITSRPSGLSMR